MKKSKAGGLAPASTPAQPAREESSLIILAEIIDQYVEMTFDNATSQFHCLADLIAHHPCYQREVAAMRQICAGRDILIQTSNESQRL